MRKNDLVLLIATAIVGTTVLAKGQPFGLTPLLMTAGILMLIEWRSKFDRSDPALDACFMLTPETDGSHWYACHSRPESSKLICEEDDVMWLCKLNEEVAL